MTPAEVQAMVKAKLEAPDFPFNFKDGKSAADIFESKTASRGHTFDDLILLVRNLFGRTFRPEM
jgi:hypothetical protein